MSSALEMIDMGIRDTSGDGQVRQPDPSKWEKPRDDGKGKHAGELEQDDQDEQAGDNN
jgi:hypothetical protein